jgi:hypothetical protein
MCRYSDFSDLGEAKGAVREADRLYRGQAIEPVSVEISSQQVGVTSRTTGEGKTFGLEGQWRFTGSLEDLRAWWEEQDPRGTHTFKPPVDKGSGHYQVNLMYQVRGSGKKAFNFHLTVPKQG